jgi:adenylate cyclase
LQGNMSNDTVARKLTVILFADVSGYSYLTGVDEVGTHKQLASGLDLISRKIKDAGGHVVNYAGDAVLAEFASVVAAIESAVEIQRSLVNANANVSDDKRLEFRIGVNLGEVIVDRDGIYGDGVNIAARLESLAEPGGIWISSTVHDQVVGKTSVIFEDMGSHKVKNIARPISAYRVLLETTDAVGEPVLELEKPSMSDKPSIAILPFENMSGDPEQEYFADGIAEDIITSLSKLSQLLVIARNSTFAYKGKPVDLREVARDLGVRYIVEGSVRKARDRVRITAQLIDSVTGGHLWADRFDRGLADVLAVQDEVTHEIVSAMALKLTADEEGLLKHKSTENLEAYDYFLRGRTMHWDVSKDSNAQAQAFFNRAIDLDSTFAPAYAFLAEELVLDYINQWSDATDHLLERAFDLAQEAVKLDDAYARAHFALGNACLWMRRHDQASAAFETAVALDPNFATGHMGLGWVLQYAGRSEEAIGLINRGMRLDPHYLPFRLHWLAQAYFQLGRFDEAIDILKQRVARDPNTDISHVLLAASFGHLDRVAEAREEWAAALNVNPNYSLEHRRQVLPYKNPDDFNLLVEGLRKAGLPA